MPGEQVLVARGRWMVERLAEIGAGGEDAVDVERLEAAFGPSPTGFDLAYIRRLWATAARRMGHGRVVDSEVLAPTAARILLEVDGGRRFWLSYEVEEDEPHRLVRWNTSPAVPAGLTIRQAELPADAPGLAALEREAPIVLADRAIRFDFDVDEAYGDSWALLDDPGAVVAEADGGAIVASAQLSIVPFRVGGADYRGGYTHRIRTHPSRAGEGLLMHLTEAGLAAKPVGPGSGGGAMDALVVAIGKGNESMLKGWAGRPGEWPVGPTRFVVDAGAAAASEAPDLRAADLEDAVRIVNAGREGDEGFVPYTTDSFAARLGRAPHLYGAGDVLRHGEAVVGVWRAGERVRTIVTTDAGEDVQRRAIAADWGVVPGHEDDLAALLGAICAQLSTTTRLTHLCVYASPPTPGWRVLETLPAERDEFHLWTLPVQPAGSDRGTYVDALAF